MLKQNGNKVSIDSLKTAINSTASDDTTTSIQYKR